VSIFKSTGDEPLDSSLEDHESADAAHHTSYELPPKISVKLTPKQLSLFKSLSIDKQEFCLKAHEI
jgi:hypothetical protein